MTLDDQVGGHLTYDEPDYGDEIGVHVTGKAKATGSASPFGGERNPDPCSLVMFGVTGDLAHRKLIPALYDLGCHGVLPFGTTLVGYGRQELTDDGFRDLMRQAIDDFYGVEVVDGDMCDRLLQEPRYVQGQFDDPEGFKRLAAVLDELDGKGAHGNRMFYLATPPSQFGVLVEQLGKAGLARPGAFAGEHDQDGERGWTRVVIEKPFGRDLETARELDRVIGQVFDERQVYRIDHYLAKETVQNLLVLRFANGIFEPVWNRRYVDFVEITAAETLGVEHRGPYYEEAGALRDMITPHLVQLFTLVAMEPPASFDADGVRDEKMKVLRAVRPIPLQSVGDWAVRAQYVQGRVDGESVPAYRARGAGRAGFLHGELRGAQAPRRQLALAGRAVLPAHRQAYGAPSHRDRHPLQAAAGSSLPRRPGGRRPAAQRARAARAAGRGLLAEHRVQTTGPRRRAAAGRHGLLLRHHTPRASLQRL